jgi:hypothetical protein
LNTSTLAQAPARMESALTFANSAQEDILTQFQPSHIACASFKVAAVQR